jgi:hypothetical protein
MEAKRSRSLEILLIPIWWLAIAMRDSGDQLQTKKRGLEISRKHRVVSDRFLALDKNRQTRRFRNETW